MRKVLLLLLLLQGCASSAITPEFRTGDIAIARNFTAYPQYEGMPVTVTGDFGWRWIKGGLGNTLRCYEITTTDGLKLAAQQYQLKRITQGQSLQP